MNMKFAALATAAAIAVTPFAAFAQSAPAPINQTGPGITAPVSTSTDMGIAGVSGNTWAVPGGIYATGPRAALAVPGSESYAAVPGSGYYTAPGVGAYGTYASPGGNSTYFDED